MVFAVVSRLVVKKRRARRLTPHDYSHVPKDSRIYYELISDTIMQMRYRVGDMALEIAQKVDGLVIDEKSGRVLDLKKSPAKVIALLILYYEKYLGERISFSLRTSDDGAKKRLASVNKNLVIVRKYFE